jgi:hypothetical protein
VSSLGQILPPVPETETPDCNYLGNVLPPVPETETPAGKPDTPAYTKTETPDCEILGPGTLACTETAIPACKLLGPDTSARTRHRQLQIVSYFQQVYSRLYQKHRLRLVGYLCRILPVRLVSYLRRVLPPVPDTEPSAGGLLASETPELCTVFKPAL